MRQTLIWVALAALLFVPLAFNRELMPPDEPRFALIARELYEQGDWIVMHRMGEPYLDKPPLLFWLAALTMHLFGAVSDGLTRVPVLLATLATTALLHREVLRTRGAALAGTAVAIWLTSVLVLSRGAWMATDMLLCCFVLATLVALDRNRPVCAGLMLALAILSKGPVALLWIGMAIVAGWNGRTLARPIAIATVVLVVGAWLVPAGMQLGWNKLVTVIWHQNGERFLDSWDNPEPWWYQLTALFTGFSPWSVVLLPFAVRNTWPVKNQRRWIWLALGMLIFFSIPAGKRGVYLLPLYPILAIACAEALECLRHQRAGRIAASLAGAIALVWAVAALSFDALALHWRLPHADAVRPAAWLLFGSQAVGLFAVATQLWRGKTEAPRALLWATLSVSITAPWLLNPALDRTQQAREASLRLARAIPTGSRLALSDTKPDLIAWYGKLAGPTLRTRAERRRFAAQPGVALIGRWDELQTIASRHSGRIVAREKIGRVELAVLVTDAARQETSTP